MVLTAITLNVWGDPTMRTATDVRSVPSSSLLNQTNTAAILWMGRCFAKLAIWAWFQASTNTGLTAWDKLQLMEKCHKSGFKEREGRLCMCILKMLEYKHHRSFSNRTMMKYDFFHFFLHYIMLSENPPILLLYLIILHSINSTKCTKCIYATDSAKTYGKHHLNFCKSQSVYCFLITFTLYLTLYIKNETI